MTIPCETQTVGSRLRGQKLRISSLDMFSGWPRNVNPLYEKTRDLTDQILDSVERNPQRLRGFKKADFGLLACVWFPSINWEQMQTTVMLIVWIFIHDDMYDQPDGDAAHDANIAQSHTARTLEYTRKVLGLDDSPDADPVPSVTGLPSNSLDLLGIFATRIRPHTDRAQRERIYQEVSKYLKEVLVERLHNSNPDTLPKTDDYTTMRLLTSGVYIFIAFVDFLAEVRLPESLMASQAMANIWREVNYVLSFENDLYSLQKEMVDERYMSIIPIRLFNETTQDVAQIVRAVEQDFSSSRKIIDESVISLEAMAGNDPAIVRDIHAYVERCRTMVTGNLDWHLQTPRYGISRYLQSDGSLEMVL